MVKEIIQTAFQSLILRKKYLWIAPLCNLRADRAPKLGKYCFPICWRCTGSLIGAIFLTVFRIPLFENKNIISLVLICPLIIDGILQYICKIESNNLRRFFTGFIFSLGIKLILI